MRSWARLILALALLPAACGPRQAYERQGGVWRFGSAELAVPRGETLTPLNSAFARSATVAWYRATPIEGADAASFQALDEHYARDRARAWQAHTYRAGEDYFSTERVRITELEAVDPARLRVLADGYAQDGAHVYYEGKLFAAADPPSFQPLEAGLARDRLRGYFRQRMIDGSDGASFESLGDHFARDRHAVYFLDVDPDAPPALTVAGADPATFRPFDYGYGKDARRAYFTTRALDADAASFQVLDFGYAKTAIKVFYNGEPVPGADAASFAILAQVTEAATARDRASLYKDGRRVGPASAGVR